MTNRRQIPFGYSFTDGEAKVCKTEADAVNAIFMLYSEGLSYDKIAQEMMWRGIWYHDGRNKWDKKIVKRILENQKYLGADNYPRLLSDDVFLRVMQRREKITVYGPLPGPLKMIQKKACCSLCNAAMTRKKDHGVRWHCTACGHRQRIDDDSLCSAIVAILTTVIQSGCLLQPAAKLTLSMEPTRLQNEISQAFDRPDTKPEFLRALILACASAKYNCLSDPTPHYRIEMLLEQLRSEPEDEHLLWSLFDEAVTAVKIHSNGVSLQLLNGQVI